MDYEIRGPETADNDRTCKNREGRGVLTKQDNRLDGQHTGNPRHTNRQKDIEHRIKRTT